MRWTPGKALVAVGALHQAVGVIGGVGALALPGAAPRNLFREIAGAGVVGAIEPDPARMVLFWFLFCGFLLLVLGGVLDRWEERGEALPASFGWQVAAVSLAGGLLIPASGFWLALAVGLWMIRRARRPLDGRSSRTVV